MTRLLDQLLSSNPWIVYTIVALIVLAEDAVFLGFVIPGETAAVIGGVAASRGHVEQRRRWTRMGHHVRIPGILRWQLLRPHREGPRPRLALAITAVAVAALVVWRVRRSRTRRTREAGKLPEHPPGPC